MSELKPGRPPKENGFLRTAEWMGRNEKAHEKHILRTVLVVRSGHWKSTTGSDIKKEVNDKRPNDS